MPQSNQRGIETPAWVLFEKADNKRLNRTSVGLKRGSASARHGDSGQPQSNQRGIETWWKGPKLEPYRMPQSNQRGIETEQEVVAIVNVQWRLNRTSVGLKLVSRPQQSPAHSSLNRTSVGLKPEPHLAQAVKNEQGLNRTSVGLKPISCGSGGRMATRPQSNQRGIETDLGTSQIQETPRASIEPAWD